jgi:hypothetical protein
MGIPVQKYRQWRAVLRSGGAEYIGQDGKNHHVWQYTPKGSTRPVTIAIAAHGDGSDVLPIYITQLRRAWKLTKADGVSDAAFLKGRW